VDADLIICHTKKRKTFKKKGEINWHLWCFISICHGPEITHFRLKSLNRTENWKDKLLSAFLKQTIIPSVISKIFWILSISQTPNSSMCSLIFSQDIGSLLWMRMHLKTTTDSTLVLESQIRQFIFFSYGITVILSPIKLWWWNPALLPRTQISRSNVGQVAHVPPTPWVNSQEADITRRGPEVACWLWQGC